MPQMELEGMFPEEDMASHINKLDYVFPAIESEASKRGHTESPRIWECPHAARPVIPPGQNSLIIIMNTGGCLLLARVHVFFFLQIFQKCISVTCEVGRDTKIYALCCPLRQSQTLGICPFYLLFQPSISSFLIAHCWPVATLLIVKNTGLSKSTAFSPKIWECPWNSHFTILDSHTLKTHKCIHIKNGKNWIKFVV